MVFVRCWANRKENNCGYVGSSRWRRLFWQGSFCCVCCSMGSQIPGSCWTLQACPCPSLLCHWCRRASVHSFTMGLPRSTRMRSWTSSNLTLTSDLEWLSSKAFICEVLPFVNSNWLYLTAFFFHSWDLDLQRSIYQSTSVYGNFCQDNPDFTWEQPKKLVYWNILDT